MNTDRTGFYTCKECHQIESLWNHITTDHKEENNWKTKETLARAVATLETERIKGSNPWCVWWWCIFILFCFVCTSVKNYCYRVTTQLQLVVVVVVVVAAAAVVIVVVVVVVVIIPTNRTSVWFTEVRLHVSATNCYHLQGAAIHNDINSAVMWLVDRKW